MSSALPKAVRAQVEKAAKLADEYYASLSGASPPDATPPTADATPPAVTPPSGDTPPAPAAATPPTSIPQDSWEQKYRVLQGKYNAEVPRLQTQVRELIETSRNTQQQLTATQNLLASLSAQRESAPAAQPTAQPAAPVRLVKDEEVREFGADLIDVVRRVAREEGSTLLTEVDRRVAPLAQRVDQAAQTVASVGQRVAANDQQSVLQQLAAAVPTWQELNEDPAFLDWLDQMDPFAGQTRGILLQQAYKAHDGPRVVAFFSGYLKEHAAVTPTPAPAPAAAAPAPQRTLDQFVAPGAPKSGTASTQDGSGKRVWSRAEIAQFYEDSRAGKYRARPDEAKKLEADIFAAQREGRIR